jgi:hypothetical protein
LQLVEIHLSHIASIREYVGAKGSEGFYDRLGQLHYQDESYFELDSMPSGATSDRQVHVEYAPRAAVLRGRPSGQEGGVVQLDRDSVGGV